MSRTIQPIHRPALPRSAGSRSILSAASSSFSSVTGVRRTVSIRRTVTRLVSAGIAAIGQWRLDGGGWGQTGVKQASNGGQTTSKLEVEDIESGDERLVLLLDARTLRRFDQVPANRQVRQRIQANDI